MAHSPVLGMSLTEVLRQEIALPLQHVLQVYTVGGLLIAWKNPRNHRCIEQVFETPEQCRHALATCAAFLGIHSPFVSPAISQWWAPDGPAN